MKDRGYDFYAAEKLRAECCAGLKGSAKDFYNAALERSRRLREQDEQLLREFEERTRGKFVHTKYEVR